MKSNMKSIRMTDEVFNAVNEFRGNGFNEKFENLVYDFLRQREQLVREAELLQAHISDKRTEMKRVQQRIAKMKDVETRLAPLVNCVLNLMDTSN
ncbi:MAG: hypothetical protein VB121_11350 [Enterococcus thailandicus]|nr:hypothetical protein [Enterococcus thailandicus]